MKMRNWLSLGRKLVDQYDMDATVQWVQQALGFYTLSYWGFGVQKTTIYPSPFPLSMSSTLLGGSVGNGFAFDPNGQLIRLTPDSVSAKTFLIGVANATNVRWDLLVIRYKQTGKNLVPKPSNPLVNVFLNLDDDFELVVRPGVASASPSYPAKQTGDVILAGLRVPANATLGTAVVVDLGIREFANGALSTVPQFRQETLGGTVNGTNQNFTLSQAPVSNASVLVFLDSIQQTPGDYSISGQTVTFIEAPAPGQVPSAFYVSGTTGSENPLSGQQETPLQVPNGVLDTFSLVGQPANQASTIVFVNGLQESPLNWDLVQSPSASQIKFHSDSIPAAGQTLSVFYMVNSASVGTGSGTYGKTPKVDYFTLTSAQVAAQKVVLNFNAVTPDITLLDVIGGKARQYGTDFSVAGNQLSFLGPLATGGADALIEGSKLRVQYWA